MARYRHPKHGYHVTGYGDDLAALKSAGWVLDEPAASPTAAAPAPQSPAPTPGPAATAQAEQQAPQPSPQPPRRESWPRVRRGR